MKWHVFTIEPQSGFSTPLKADTLFGHFCWQAWYEPSLLNESLESLLARYDKKPFVVFSSALAKLDSDENPFAGPRPALPLRRIFASGASRLDTLLAAKTNKQRQFVLFAGDLSVHVQPDFLLTSEQLQSSGGPRRRSGAEEGGFLSLSIRAHNTINRITGATGKGMFAPYETECVYYAPGTRLAVFASIDETVTDAERVSKGLQQIGKFGFGRDASSGMGRFSVIETAALPSVNWEKYDSLYTLGPSVFSTHDFSKVYFKPFIRFGRHGDRLANSANPFKNPVIMADEGAVCIAKEKLTGFSGCIGTAVRNLSKVQPEAVAQGYTLCLPLKMPA